jgi:hypothetical protein
MLAFIFVFSIGVVAAILFVAVDDLEPNRRLASVLKFLIVSVSVAAVAVPSHAIAKVSKLPVSACTFQLRLGPLAID